MIEAPEAPRAPDAPPADAAPDVTSLRAYGFSPAGAERYTEALRRLEKGEFPDLDVPVSCLLFGAYLVDRGRLTDELADEPTDFKEVRPVLTAA